jgi:hypothetical protein
MIENEETKQEEQTEQAPEQQTDESKGLMADVEQKAEEVVDDGMPTGKQEDIYDGEDLENLEFTRPETFPEKFWDEKDGPDVEGLAKAYGELEKKFHSGNGKAPKEYSLDNVKEMGFAEDDPVVNTFKEWSKANNVPQDAFDELAGKIAEMGMEAQQGEEIHIKEEKQKLGENADNIIGSNVKWGRGLVSKGVLSEDDYNELEVWGGTASGQRLLNKFRGMMGEREIPTATVEGQRMDEDELKALVADPRYANDERFRKDVERKFVEYYDKR